ncbi:MAG: heavy metal translocating P-type ATPase [Lachnospiraceae bacterium]|nr:heavy metal translocating P-type ATPase [Lachnospiraceae bacterium]
MNKKLKKKITRVAIGAALFAVGVVLYKVLFERMGIEICRWGGIAFFFAAYLTIGFDVLKNAAVNIAHGHIFDENFLMMLATIGAVACREYTEAVAVMLFYQVGECFQSYAVNKSRKSIKALMSIRPDFARVISDEGETEVDPSEVKIGDLISIRPGERVPLDGLVVDGISSLDTAPITGESLPKDVAAGSRVISGCVNLTGVLKVSVTGEFENSTVSKILTLVEEASNKKAKAENFITVFARYYTPFVVCSAVLLAVVGSIATGDPRTWIYRAMTFLLISCPCALVISVPLSFFGGIGGAGKQGILIKGGNYMDTLAKIDAVVFDKTGTITKGNFAVGEITVSEELAKEKGEGAKDYLLSMAAACEAKSNHPIAKSIVAASKGEAIAQDDSSITEIAGKGVSAEIEGIKWYAGNYKLMADVLSKEELAKTSCHDCMERGTVVYLACDARYVGHIHIVDEIKEGAEAAIAALKNAGISKTVMLTGDNEESASIVAGKVGITSFRSNLTPLDKVSAIEEILSEEKNGKVAFVGDGINDAPVLTRADIGIAMGAMGSDAAIEAADVVIMTDELSKIGKAKRIACKTLRIVRENIVFALGIKALVLILSALGITTMWAAIFADVGVAFIAIMNSMRALRA